VIRDFLQLTATVQVWFLMLKITLHAIILPWTECPGRYSTQALDVFRLSSTDKNSSGDLHSFTIPSFRSHMNPSHHKYVNFLLEFSFVFISNKIFDLNYEQAGTSVSQKIYSDHKDNSNSTNTDH